MAADYTRRHVCFRSGDKAIDAQSLCAVVVMIATDGQHMLPQL
jgi:hypothetical protein